MKRERDLALVFFSKLRPTLKVEMTYSGRLALKHFQAIKDKVLVKVHPNLARELSQFVRFLELADAHFDAKERISEKTWDLLINWRKWWNGNKQDLRFPAEVSVGRGDEFDGALAISWDGVRFP